jgi:arylsulfatase A-like enzyme
LLAACGPPAPQAAFECATSGGAAPLRAIFSDLSSGEVTRWRWDFGDGGSSTLENPVYVYRNAGTYAVSLSVEGPGGTDSLTKSALVEVTGSAPRHNVLVILADDLSVANVACYGVAPDLRPGLTPNIDSLAAEGVLFENAWGSPACTTSRALLLTGRHSFRTGIGGLIETAELSLGSIELTLPEALEAYADSGYSHAALGKWHLESQANAMSCTPTDVHGFDFFDGSPFQVGDYCDWRHLYCPPLGGAEADSRTLGPIQGSGYMPEYYVDRALAWIQEQRGPWFCLLAPQTPYAIPHVPPARLQNVKSGPECEPCANTDWDCHDAVLQAFDTKLGELLMRLGPDWRDETTIVFTADEGSVSASKRFWPRGHGKGSLYEASVRVPLIVAGRAVDPARRGTRTAELASLLDVYRTVTNLAGARDLPAAAAVDSVDLSPALRSPPAPTGRTRLFTEIFYPNAARPPFENHVAAIRDERFKLIYDCSNARPSSFFDLVSDPLEERDLLPSDPAPGTVEGDALARLRAEIAQLMGS